MKENRDRFPVPDRCGNLVKFIFKEAPPVGYVRKPKDLTSGNLFTHKNVELSPAEGITPPSTTTTPPTETRPKP